MVKTISEKQEKGSRMGNACQQIFCKLYCLFATNSRQESSDEPQVYNATIPQRDFKDPVSTDTKNEEFCPNPQPTLTRSLLTPDVILHMSEKSLRHYKTEGCSKDKLNRLIEHYVLENGFKGWLSKDEIRKGLEYGCYFIENDGIQDQAEMKHCTALLVTDGHYEYFDSMGETLHEIPGIQVMSNGIQFQHHDYATCGLHAVYFLRERDKLGSLKKVQDSYPSRKDLELNEEFIFEYIKQTESPHSAYATHAIHVYMYAYVNGQKTLQRT